jgi:putative sugar O-methyltransferase
LTDTALLTEDPVGGPPTVAVGDGETVTSSNTVHQLHHLLRYEESTGRSVRDATTIVEWGGGFGSLIRLVTRMHGGKPTCVVVDTPVFSAVQWLYLSAVFGEDHVVLHEVGPVRPERGKINIVPIGLVGDLVVSADLFISNWALNESTPAAQDDVLAQRWFGAKALLLAMHAGDPLTELAVARGARAVPIGSWMPGQQYLVA